MLCHILKFKDIGDGDDYDDNNHREFIETHLNFEEGLRRYKQLCQEDSQSHYRFEGIADTNKN